MARRSSLQADQGHHSTDAALQQNLCRVELEAAAAQGGLIYRVQESVGQSVELTPESFHDRVLYWIEDEHAQRTAFLLHDSHQSVQLFE
jgi:hypothetical protein